jgi:glycolate oxidase
MPDMFTEADLETMQWVRQVFNPKGLANPGKIFPHASHLWGSGKG